MTWTVTERVAATGAAGSSSVVSSSFTPSANSVLVFTLQRSNDGSVSSISGHGTWSQVGSTVTDVLGAGSNRDAEIWACRVGASPGASTVTINRNYIFRFDYQIIELSETSGLNGTTVADVFGTPATNGASTGSSTTLSDTLSSFAQSTNLTLVFGFNEFPHNGAYWAPSTGYTELSEWVSGSSNSNCATAYIASEDTSPSIDWTFSYGNIGMWAVEVKHAAASSSGGLLLFNANNSAGF